MNEATNQFDPILGIDIGGANIKFVDTAGRCLTRVFPMWNESEQLTEMLAQMASEFGWEGGRVGITMTGELADCFETRSQGVCHIVQQAEAAFGEAKPLYYGVDGTWTEGASVSEELSAEWLVLAASNWHALANWAGQSLLRKEAFLLVDIGSTTVDVIPIVNGRVASESRTDKDRLLAGELVYTGMERTPIPTIMHAVQVNEQKIPLMAERFADSHDAYLWLGLVAEEPSSCDTADRRPRTRKHAAGRLAHLIGEDRETVDASALHAIANQVIEAQVDKIAEAVHKVAQANGIVGDRLRVLFSGHAAPLESLLKQRLPICEALFLREILGADLSRCAPAYAIAQLLNADPSIAGPHHVAKS
ncbi:MAG: hydantoinase/oxoprolinase family protein [Aureliella sp.]